MKTITTTVLFFAAMSVMAQEYNVNRIELHQRMHNDYTRSTIHVPAIKEYQTLKCDFHIHTVFSDGDVWPTTRVREAWQEGLDVIAITDHTSAEPSKKNVIGGPNTSYEIAKPEAEKLGITLIQATEISRSKEQGGHLNALFITDAVPTLNPDTEKAVEAAVEQGGYIIWNHPGWAIDTCKSFEPNDRMLKKGHIHAVEVFNEAEWYPRALRWTLEHNIAPIANSDVHGLVKNQYNCQPGIHRPMTLVFAKDKSLSSVKEALLARRTLAYFNHSLAGDATLMSEFMNACLTSEHITGNRYLVTNTSDIPFEIKLEKGGELTIPANAGIIWDKEEKTLKGNVRNLHVDEFKTLDVEIIIAGQN